MGEEWVHQLVILSRWKRTAGSTRCALACMASNHGGTAQQQIVAANQAQLVTKLLAQAAQRRVRREVQNAGNALGRGCAVEDEKLLEAPHVLLHRVELIRIDARILGMQPLLLLKILVLQFLVHDTLPLRTRKPRFL